MEKKDVGVREERKKEDMYACICVHIYICVCVCVSGYVCVCVCVYIYAYKCMSVPDVAEVPARVSQRPVH